MKNILVFNIMGEELGVDVSLVREVLESQTIHPFPRAPEFIEGVINLRGHIIGVIDLGKKLRLQAAKHNTQMRIIVCKVKRFIVGLIVDGVDEVISVPDENIEPTPEVLSIQIEDSFVSAIARVDQRIITLLDLENILAKKEIESLMQAQPEITAKRKPTQIQ